MRRWLCTELLWQHQTLTGPRSTTQLSGGSASLHRAAAAPQPCCIGGPSPGSPGTWTTASWHVWLDSLQCIALAQGPFSRLSGQTWVHQSWTQHLGSPCPMGGPTTPPRALPAVDPASWVSLAGLGRQRAGLRVQTPHPAQLPLALFGEPQHPARACGTLAHSTPEAGCQREHQRGTQAVPPPRLGLPLALGGHGGPNSRPCHPWGREKSPTRHLPRRAAAIPSPARHPPATGQLLRQQGAEAATLAPWGAGTFHLPPLMWWEWGGGGREKGLLLKKWPRGENCN